METVILIRHATPEVKHRRCDWQQAQQYLTQYNHTSQLKLEEIRDQELQPYLPPIRHFYCSSLIRARKTAEKLLPNQTFQIEEQLQEFNLNIAPIPYLKLSFPHWLVLSRMLWFCGLNPSERTWRQEKQRIARFVQQQLNDNSLIVAHGFVLREIKQHLLKQAFQRRILIKQGCFSVEVLVKKGSHNANT